MFAEVPGMSSENRAFGSTGDRYERDRKCPGRGREAIASVCDGETSSVVLFVSSAGRLADDAVFDRVRVAEGWRLLMEASILTALDISGLIEDATVLAEPATDS